MFFLSLCVYCIICLCFGLSSTWYESIFCVFLGVKWGKYKDIVEQKIDRHMYLVVGSSLILFLVTFLISKIGATPFNILSKMICLFYFSFLLKV